MNDLTVSELVAMNEIAGVYVIIDNGSITQMFMEVGGEHE